MLESIIARQGSIRSRKEILVSSISVGEDKVCRRKGSSSIVYVGSYYSNEESKSAPFLLRLYLQAEITLIRRVRLGLIDKVEKGVRYLELGLSQNDRKGRNISYYKV